MHPCVFVVLSKSLIFKQFETFWEPIFYIANKSGLLRDRTLLLFIQSKEIKRNLVPQKKIGSHPLQVK